MNTFIIEVNGQIGYQLAPGSHHVSFHVLDLLHVFGDLSQ